MSGLASLSATYQGTFTDSEGEDDSHNPSDSPEKSVAVLVQQAPKPTQNTQNSGKLAQLVSYHDDTVLSDDEAGAGVHHLEKHDNGVVSLEDNKQQPKVETSIADIKEEETNTQSDEDDIQLPPEPNGYCNIDLQEKIYKLSKRMETSSYDINQVIQNKKDFRNPSIYEKLIQYCSINELGTNYPPSIYNPGIWGKESFYDELSKAQKVEMEKKEKERKERAKVEFVSGTAKRNISAANIDESKNRKSKWDQVGGLAPAISAPGLVGAVGVKQPASLSMSASLTKGTVISAFGSLPKRPKL